MRLLSIYLRATLLTAFLSLVFSVKPAQIGQNSPFSGAAKADVRGLAIRGVDDLLRHYWVGDPATGHMLDTWSGYARKGDDRGVLWERAMFLAVLDDQYTATKDPRLRQRIAADWTYLKRRFTTAELQACGNGANNGWQDDAGWSTLLYLSAYRHTGDPEALEDAKALFRNAYDRWADDRFGGGLWYDDKREVKSIYQASLILAGLRLAERTKDRTYRDRAIKLYDWVEAHLLRANGLYWCDYRATGPQDTGSCREAASDTFLGGNMAMGIIHARLYRETKDKLYLQRAQRTMQAVSTKETDGKGALLDDRDAWTNGYFTGDWAREVLTLPGTKPEYREIVRRTALAIAEHARTPEGYYRGCWNGPAKGGDCAWEKAGFKSDQIMTSASAVHVLVAASLLK